MLAVRVLRLAGLLSSIGDELAAPAGQTSARWQVLAAIEVAPMPVADIARRLGLARQSVQRVADLLESERLASYDANPDHARAKLLRLTSAGRSKLDAIQRAQCAWADGVGQEVGEATLARTNEALDLVLAALQQARSSGAR